jgi:hypothetical protein
MTAQIDGTSATATLMDEVTGEVLTAPLMYDAACPDALPAVQAIAPAGHTVLAATSTLCKLVHWQQVRCPRQSEQHTDGV